VKARRAGDKGNGVDAASALSLEAIFTFFPCGRVRAAVDALGPFSRSPAWLIVLTITIDVLFGRRPLTCARDEPLARLWAAARRRLLGQPPCLVAGPLAGATVAALLYSFFLYLSSEMEPVGSADSGFLEPPATPRRRDGLRPIA